MNLDAELNKGHVDTLPDEWIARALPTRPNSKAAAHRDCLVRKYARHEMGYWTARGYGIGMKVGDGVMGVDIDDAGFRDEAKEMGLDSNLVVRTRRGFHLWMRTTLADQKTVIKWRGKPLDFKFSGYLMWPPTVVDSFRYTLETRLLSLADLPVFPSELLTEPEKEPKATEVTRRTCPRTERAVRNPLEYVLRIDSVQGSNGSAGLVRATCVLRDSGVPSDEAFTFLVRVWNPAKAVPPWSQDEIAYCINRHYGKR